VKPKTALLSGVVIAALGLVCSAKTPTLTGKIVAYDPLLHAAKAGSFVANKEVVILEVPASKAKYVKVMFVSFGTTQIEQKYFDGTLPLAVHAIRDHSCDERSPTTVTQLSSDQRSGIYLLTDAFKNSPPSNLKKLECYDATEKK
jgi:hypothetical protein